jgi:excinuclease ABC subunit A
MSAYPSHRAAQDPDYIEVIGSREHNLDVLRLEVPKRKLVVFTGVSGSGKSSLAFDTLYAEGQRRYVETLSAYARQFLGQLERPRVEHLRGLSPTIAIEQKSASGNPRSTVGTITEIYDYLRVLYAKIGKQHCHVCGKPVRSQTSEEIANEVLRLPAGTQLTLLAPLVSHRKGEYRELLGEMKSRGFARVMIDGKLHHLDDPPHLDKKKKHSILVVVDRITLRDAERLRLTEGIELALREGAGELRVATATVKSSSSARSGLAAAWFSGAIAAELFVQRSSRMYQACNGWGAAGVDEALVVPNRALTIREGAIAPWASAMARGEGWVFRIADAVARACQVELDAPWNKLGKKKQSMVLYGLGGRKIAVTWGKEGTESHGTWGMRYQGVIPSLMRKFQQTSSEAARDQYRKFMSEQPCDTCKSKRLRPESLSVRAFGKGVAEVTSMTVRACYDHFGDAPLSAQEKRIAEALGEIRSRLFFLLNVGLDYLTLDRSGPSLSEAKRNASVASQLGSELSGVIYVLDEPSIGLHQRDNKRLIETLRRLRDLGNTVLVVEHDEETIRGADHVVDFGPGAGHMGGRVIFSGSPDELARHPTSLTGAYLSGRCRIAEPRPEQRRKSNTAVVIRGASENNLKHVDVSFPTGILTAVTGVSGAGKSSLVNGILLPALARHLHGSTDRVGAPQHRRPRSLDKVIAIDQKPIGRTPRSNPDVTRRRSISFATSSRS